MVNYDVKRCMLCIVAVYLLRLIRRYLSDSPIMRHAYTGKNHCGLNGTSRTVKYSASGGTHSGAFSLDAGMQR